MSEGFKHKIRRDLGRWSRKLLLCLGLESIGSELVGERNWRHLYPLCSDWERDKEESPVSDFDPSEPISFSYTAHDLFPDLSNFPSANFPQTDDEDEEDDKQVEERNGTYENMAHLLPYWYFINRAFGTAPPSSVGYHANISDDLNSRNDKIQNPSTFAEALDAQQLNAFLLLHSLKQQQERELQFQAQAAGNPDFPPMRFPNLQEFKDPRELIRSIKRTQRQRPQCNSAYSRQKDMEDEPLDLTCKKKLYVSDKPSQVKSGQLISPEVSSSNAGRDVAILERYSKLNLKSNPRAGRGYTTVELEAALNDIQSGKLGTRRAAVIYGIPRSTLRNKVYKLGKDITRPFHRLKSKVSPVGKLEYVSNFPVSKGSAFSPVTKGTGGVAYQDLVEGSGDEVKSEEDIISHEKKILKEWLQSKLSRKRLSAAEEADGIEYLGPGGSRLPQTTAVATISGNSSGDCSDEGTQDFTPDGTQLSQDTNSYDIPRRLLKRRYYAQEEQSSPNTAQSLTTPTILTSPIDTELPDWKALQANDDDGSTDELDLEKGDKGQGDYYDPLDPDAGNLSDGDGSGKKSRPKRGKYRNYDRDALVKAVKAVQNGEMSVHRAGSHFGVPHSTLEYKVKERHLLRRPTRKGSLPGNGTSKQKSSPENSLSGSEAGTTPTTPIHLPFSPVAPTTRETLTRFLTEAASHTLRRRSQGSSDSGSIRGTKVPRNESDSRNSPSPFQLNDLLRRNFDNSSLLNMTKNV